MLNKNMRIDLSIAIDTTPSDVWDALINPEKINKYFFGTKAKSDWKQGSELIFEGEWEGVAYVDKATILAIEPEKLLTYNYISSFSKLDDSPENRAEIVMKLENTLNGTTLNLSQIGFESEESYEHSQNSWKSILSDLKKRVETNDWS